MIGRIRVALCKYARKQLLRYWENGSELSVAQHASVLILEATHGLLRTRGIVRDEDNWQRVEALCVAEENRWIAKLEDDDIRSDLDVEFDPSAWDDLHNTRYWERFQAIRLGMSRDKKATRRNRVAFKNYVSR